MTGGGAGWYTTTGGAAGVAPPLPGSGWSCPFALALLPAAAPELVPAAPPPWAFASAQNQLPGGQLAFAAAPPPAPAPCPWAKASEGTAISAATRVSHETVPVV